MQIAIADISPVEKRVDFELPWGEVAPRLEKAYKQLQRDVHIKGFRPGKVPRAVIEKLYKERVEGDVAHELIELSLGRAISENQLQPVAPAQLEKMELKAGQPFKFTARVEVRSQVVPKDYGGLRLSRRPPKVTDEDIASALEERRRELTQYHPVTGRDVTAESDVVVIEVHGKIGGHKLKTRTVMVDLADENGGGLPGLGPKLRGLSIAAGHHEIRYSLPEDSQVKELAGKPVHLHVTIKEARERKLPALDDDFAKDTGEADTLAELKTKVRERLVEQDRERIKRELFAQIEKEIVKRNEFPLAPAVIDRQAEVMVRRLKAQFMLMGIDVEAGGFDDQKAMNELRGDAEQEARAAILVQAIAEREGIAATDADLQKKLAELAAARHDNPKKLRAEMEKSGRLPILKAQIVEEKTLELLLSQAKIVDEEPDKLIVTPDEAMAGKRGRLILTPEEAQAEAETHAQGHEHHEHAHGHHGHDHGHGHHHHHGHEHHEHAHGTPKRKGK